MISRGINRSASELIELFQRQDRTIIMGVVNTTPDSFSDGGCFADAAAAITQALKLVEEGADIIDVGGESTRPGAAAVAADEEMRRVIPVIAGLAERCRVAVSVDTYKAAVAREAMAAGASIVNDVSALGGDDKMTATIAEAGAGVVLMHKRGTPQTMQKDTNYGDLIGEIVVFLGEAIRRAESGGIDPRLIMVDPGIGFGKDVEGNLEIIRSVSRLKALGKPVLIGASRKSFIGRLSGADVGDRLAGSLAAATAAVLNGATAVRVHDVRETRQAVDLAIKLRGAV